MRKALLAFSGLLFSSGLLLSQIAPIPEAPTTPAGGGNPSIINPLPAPAPDLPVTPSEAIPQVPADAKPALQELLVFLGARTWEERINSIAMETTLRSAFAQYYSTHPDGPQPYTSIEQFTSDKKPQGEAAEYAFLVHFKDLDHAVPTKLVLTKAGYKVDWPLFVEFKDEQLLEFAKSYHETTGRFHVMIHRAHYFQKDVPQLEEKQCYEVQPPLPGYVIHAFVEKDTRLARLLEKPLSWDVSQAFAIVELKWKKKGQYQWIEIADVPQFDWHDTFKIGGAAAAATAKKKKTRQ